MHMENRSTYRMFEYRDLGLIDYKEAWDLQHETFEKRNAGEVSDILYLLEHPNTYTLGKTANRINLIGSEEFIKKYDFKIYDIDRGGDITYHGPGQIVGYPIINLKDWYQDTHKYLRNLEEVIIQTCAEYDLEAGRKEEYTGVWIGEKKICAIGIKVSRWITMHGFAMNVNTNLDLFGGIIPCGITDKKVTSLQCELGKEISLTEVKGKIVENFKKLFKYDEFKTLEKGAF